MAVSQTLPFGSLLKRLRRAADLTQEQLAARAGYTANYVSMLERGVRAPLRPTVDLLATALGLDAAARAELDAARRVVLAPGESDGQAPSPRMASGQAASSLVLEQTPPSTPARRRHNLPAQPTPLLGREQTVDAVRALLRRADARLATLTGPAGVGKTRLAIEIAAGLLDDFAGGAWFVRLARLADPAFVLPAVAQALGLQETKGQPIAETLRAFLADKRLLLVLDNFEHLVAAAGDVAELLEASPGLTVLVTSRVVLRLRGEKEVSVPPLPMPATRLAAAPEKIEEYAAVALFVARSRDARPDFHLTAANARAVTEICARLDGLPLAIELAAARIKILPPEALLARLSDRLGLLASGPRDLDERQRTMRAALAWSEHLLAPEERVLFRRVAVFAGGCTLEAAEAVCAAPEGDAPLGMALLDGLGALLDHSLVRHREVDGEPRFGMLHVVREYALEQLVASGEGEALRRAHFGYFLALAEDPDRRRPPQRAWLDRLEREHDNLRAALGWARDRGEPGLGLRLAVAATPFWMVRGHVQEGRTWMETLLAAEATDEQVDGAVRIRALGNAGEFALEHGDLAAARRWISAHLALARAAGDRRESAIALNNLGGLMALQGDLDQAAEHNGEALALSRQLGDMLMVAASNNGLGMVAYTRRDLARALAHAEEAVALARQMGNPGLLSNLLDTLARVVTRRGDLPRATTLGREALRLAQGMGAPGPVANSLGQLGMAAGIGGDGERAARLLGASAAWYDSMRITPPDVERRDVEEAMAPARAALGEEAWAAAYAAGQALAPEDAIAEALGTSDPVPQRRSQPRSRRRDAALPGDTRPI